MTKKDYVLMANAFKTASESDLSKDNCIHYLIETFASLCANDNPKFDRNIFNKACK